MYNTESKGSILPGKKLKYYKLSNIDENQINEDICSWTLDSETTYHMIKIITCNTHLNNVFWEDEINTAIYINNRMPHRGIDNKVPYELLYNKKVDYNRFKVFVAKYSSLFLNNSGRSYKTCLFQVSS